MHPLIGELSNYPDAAAHVRDLANADPDVTPRPDAISVEVGNPSGLEVLRKVVETISRGSGPDGRIPVVARVSSVSPSFTEEVAAIVDAMIIPIDDFEASRWSDDAIERLGQTGRPLFLEITVRDTDPDWTRLALNSLQSRLEWAASHGCRDLAISIRALSFQSLIRVGRQLEQLGDPSTATYPVLLGCEFGDDHEIGRAHV